MSRRKAVPPAENVAAVKELAPSLKRGKARDLEMFKLWMQGASCESMAKQYGLKVAAVWRIKRRDCWEKLRKELINRFYSKFAMKLKGFTVRVSDVMDKDFVRLEEKVNRGEALDKDERRYLTRLADILFKENRLTDGKPTEIGNAGGVVKHEIKLPPGVRRFGVIPADSNVKPIEHAAEVQKEEKTGRISIDDVDEG